MTMDLFPLGQEGVTLDRMERAQKGSVLESKVRLPTMEDVIIALAYVRMIKTIARGNKTQSCPSYGNMLIVWVEYNVLAFPH